MNNLAMTMLKQGDVVGAQPVQRAVVDISRRVLGPEHPDAAIYSEGLAHIQYALGIVDGDARG